MNADPEAFSWLRLLLAFTVVFSLLAAMGFALKYIKTKGLVIPGLSGKAGPVSRLVIKESLALDMRRRLVIVKCDQREHLLLLGQDHDIVIDTRLDQNQPSPGLPPISKP